MKSEEEIRELLGIELEWLNDLNEFLQTGFRTKNYFYIEENATKLSKSANRILSYIEILED